MEDIYFADNEASPFEMLKELRSIDLPDSIKELATEIFHQTVKNITRGKNRLCLIFASVVQAYQKAGMVLTDYNFIADALGLKRKHMRHALQQFKILNHQANMSNYSSAKNLIPELLDKLNLIYSAAVLQNLYDKVIDKSDFLNRILPRSLAVALIYYQLQKEGYDVQYGMFNELDECPCQITIKKICSELEKLDE